MDGSEDRYRDLTLSPWSPISPAVPRSSPTLHHPPPFRLPILLRSSFLVLPCSSSDSSRRNPEVQLAMTMDTNGDLCNGFHDGEIKPINNLEIDSTNSGDDSSAAPFEDTLSKPRAVGEDDDGCEQISGNREDKTKETFKNMDDDKLDHGNGDPTVGDVIQQLLVEVSDVTYQITEDAIVTCNPPTASTSDCARGEENTGNTDESSVKIAGNDDRAGKLNIISSDPCFEDEEARTSVMAMTADCIIPDGETSDMALNVANGTDLELNELNDESSHLQLSNCCHTGETAGGRSQVDELIPENTAPPTAEEAALNDASASSTDDVVEEPFLYLIKMPRYENDTLRNQIDKAQQQVEEKTRARDAIRFQIQNARATCKEHRDKFETAILEEKEIRDRLKQKRLEMDSLQRMLDKVKDVESSKEIGRNILDLDFKIEHESLTLNEEKQYVREIKQLKNVQEQLSFATGNQDEVKQALESRNDLEKQTKVLKKDADDIKNRLSRAEFATKEFKSIYFDQRQKVNELQARFKSADEIRQETYLNLQVLRKQFYDKSKYFHMYKNDVQTAYQLTSARNLMELDRLCRNQVDTIMNLWNTDKEFRKDYLRCNAKSTMCRLKTTEYRSFASDDVLTASTGTMSELIPVPAESSIPIRNEEKQVVKNKSGTEMTKPENKIVKSSPDVEPAIDRRTKTEEDEEEARERMKDEAVRLKEQRRMQEKAKAKVAEERKRKKAEKTKARAEFRAQKEAEQKEKEMEKRARKRERRKMTAIAEKQMNCMKQDGEESEDVSDAASEMPKESSMEEDLAIVKKLQKRPVPHARRTKSAPVPLPLRSKGKRRIQPWMWTLLALISILAFLFVTANTSSAQHYLDFLKL